MKKTLIISRVFITSLCILLGISMCLADFSSNDAGTSTAQFLKIGVGARAIGMGEAQAGLSNDVNAIYWNPAGLNKLDSREASLMHCTWLESISYQYLGYAQPTKVGVFGIAVNYLSMDAIQKVDNTGTELNDTFSPTDMAITISHARMLGKIPFGVNLKYISSSIDDASATAFAVDLGMMHRVMNDKLSENTQYTRYVKAGNETGLSVASSTSSVYTHANIPVSPTHVTSSSDTITITWGTNSNPAGTSYQVMYATGQFFTTSTTAPVIISSTDTVTGLTPATTYYLKVKAINFESISTVYSSTISALTNAVIPDAPQGLFGVAQSTYSIVWQWDITNTATYYQVFTSTDGFLTETLGNGTTTWTENIDLSDNTMYTRYVKAGNETGLSVASSTSSIYTLANPPASITISTVTSTSVGLSWSSSGATEYRIEKSSSPDGVWIYVDNPTGTTYTVPSLMSDTTYFFRSGAINGDGIQTPLLYSTVSDTVTLPSAPTEVNAQAQSVFSIKWMWSTGTYTGSNIIGYRIYYATSTTKLAELNISSNSWTETNLSTNTEYSRKILAYNSSGESDSVTISSYTLATAPSNLVVSTTTKHTATLNWTGYDSSKYRINKSTNNADWSTVSSNITETTYKVDELMLSTTYYFAVWGYNGDGIITTSSDTESGITQGLPETISVIVTTSTETQEQTVTSPVIGDIKVAIAPGTVDKDVYVEISTDAINNPKSVPKTVVDNANTVIGQEEDKELLTNTVVEFNMYDLLGSTVTTFVKSVIITIPYPDADDDGIVDGTQIKEISLRIFTLNPTSGKWEIVGGTVNATANNVAVDVAHFSLYGIVSVKTSESDLTQVKVYPNPYKPGSNTVFDNPSQGTGIVFDKLTPKADIKIFTIAGELVIELNETDGDGENLWDTLNMAGNKVASGVYIYLVTNPDDTSQKPSKGKFAIVR